MKIVGFMHIAQMGNWRDVVQEQLNVVRESGLSDRCDEIQLGVLGNRPMIVKQPFRIAYQSPSLEFFEYETLKRLWIYSQEHEGLVWYIHTKGVSKTQEYWEHNEEHYLNKVKIDSLEKLRQNEQEWRHYMQHFNIKKHKDCIKGLESCDLAGASWRQDDKPHFSGNFWWATTKYIKTLPDPYSFSGNTKVTTDEDYMRWGAEFWVGSNNPKVCSFSNLKHNFYRWGIPWWAYIPLFV